VSELPAIEIEFDPSITTPPAPHAKNVPPLPFESPRLALPPVLASDR
jgi:hypothetical protein